MHLFKMFFLLSSNSVVFAFALCFVLSFSFPYNLVKTCIFLDFTCLGCVLLEDNLYSNYAMSLVSAISALHFSAMGFLFQDLHSHFFVFCFIPFTNVFWWFLVGFGIWAWHDLWNNRIRSLRTSPKRRSTMVEKDMGWVRRWAQTGRRA